MLQRLAELAGANPALFLILMLILIVASLFIGYLVGSNKFNKQADSAVNDVIEDLKYKGAVSNSIIENVGLGVLAYDKNGLVYSNHALTSLSGFLGSTGQPPKTIEEFLNKYDKKNHLKSNYILNLENQESVVRANYMTDTRIYEIKIIHRFYEDTRIDIVIVDDITQIKDDERRQKDLAANVSHELKTPIALIQGYAEGLKEGINDDEESKDFYCEVIMDEASKMNIMVKKLLTLNQLEFGNENATMERFDIVELVKNYVKSAELLARQKEATVKIGNYKPIFVWGDEFRVEEVLQNYFSNALNHIGGEKIVDIKITEKENKVRVSVFNTGNPIPEDSLKHIWDKFYKVDKARTREYGGSGVGLSIVKAIMESMNQDYGVINYDNGVEFYFELETK